MINKYRYILAGVLILFIIVMGIIVYIKRDTIFLHKIEIQYPDGCIETLHNGVLVSPECIEGRILDEQNKAREQWYMNLTNPTDLR